MIATAIAVATAILSLAASHALAQPDSTRVIRYAFTVAARPSEVWAAWTTPEGLRSFFGPAARVEPTPFGRFDIHFDPNAPLGEKGAEGNIVLAVQPERLLSTTWDAPPNFPSVRAQRTFLKIRLAPDGAAKTRVVITQSGFGDTAEWTAVYEYFRGAWTWVAAALQYRFDVGPLDWKQPPNLLPRMQAIGGDVALEWAKSKG